MLTIKSLHESAKFVSSRKKHARAAYSVTKEVSVNPDLRPVVGEAGTVDETIGDHARALSSQLQAMSEA
ncbi:hypothetical protein ABTA54_19860, partial [Acinetobacter baumannii]